MLLYGGAPQVDVALGLDGSYLPFAVNRCLIHLHGVDLTGLDGAVLEEGASLTEHGVPFDHGYICLNVDGAVVETMPTSLWNLTEDEWTGKVAIPSPLSSSPGRAFFLATLQGLGDDAWSWWEAMLLNEPIITTGWSEAYEIHYSGGYGVWEEGHVGDAAATFLLPLTRRRGLLQRQQHAIHRHRAPGRGLPPNRVRRGACRCGQHHGCEAFLRTWWPKPTPRCRTRT